MNGTANPLLDREEHCLRLGESFEKRPRASFHTIRCKLSHPTRPLGCFSRHMPTAAPSFLPSTLQSPGNTLQTSVPICLAPEPLEPRFVPFYFILLGHSLPKPNLSSLSTILLPHSPKHSEGRRPLSYFISPTEPLSQISLLHPGPVLPRKPPSPLPPFDYRLRALHFYKILRVCYEPHLLPTPFFSHRFPQLLSFSVLVLATRILCLSHLQSRKLRPFCTPSVFLFN